MTETESAQKERTSMRSISQTLALSIAALSFVSHGVVDKAAMGAEVSNEEFQDVWKELVRESSRWTTDDSTREDIASDAIFSLAGKDPDYIARCMGRTVKNKVIDKVRRRHGEVELSTLGDDASQILEESAIDSDSFAVEGPIVTEFRSYLDEMELRVLDLLEDGLGEREMARQLETTRYEIRRIRESLERKASWYFEQ